MIFSYPDTLVTYRRWCF